MPTPLTTSDVSRIVTSIEPIVADRRTPFPTFQSDRQTKWGWACRALDTQAIYTLLDPPDGVPRVGDVAVVEIERVGHHTRILTAEHERMRLHSEDRLVGVFGNRYATDAFEAEVDGTDDLHILTSAGMFGTVKSRHFNTKSPTRVRFIGYLGTHQGQRINLKVPSIETMFSGPARPDVVLAVGTGMNSGKTTTAAKLVKALVRSGARVAACKVTGSVCHRDLYELRSASPHDVRDFSDYGFPSTYLCDRDELVNLFHAMVADCRSARPDVIVMEIADGILQRETTMLLQDAQIRKQVVGTVLTAPCSSSALFAIDRIRSYGHDVIAVSGLITNSPLFMRELSEHTETPIASSIGDADDLAARVLHQCKATR